jgi:hypothetical protein
MVYCTPKYFMDHKEGVLMDTHIHRQLAQRRKKWARLGMLTLVLGIVAIAGLVPSSGHAAARQRCFPETGFCIMDPFLAYWERNGGLTVFGYPIGPLQIETVEGAWTGPVQWFQRDRLEDHSNDGQGVLAGRLGARWLEVKGTPWQTFPTATDPGDPATCRFFAATSHTLCGRFRTYWEQHGGLERFGLPITEVFNEVVEGRIYEVQYFERRRMEYHQENAGTPYDVLLGLLGQLLNSGNGSPWFFSPAPPYPPSDPVVHYEGAIEQFEHGFLVWIKTPDHFLMFVDGSRYWIARAPYTFTAVPPDDAAPPQRRVRPVSGFGGVWRGEIGTFGPSPLPTVPREMLGWAVEPERPYTTEFACHGGASYNDQRCYLRGPQGEIIWYGPQGWGRWP